MYCKKSKCNEKKFISASICEENSEGSIQQGHQRNIIVLSITEDDQAHKDNISNQLQVDSLFHPNR